MFTSRRLIEPNGGTTTMRLIQATKTFFKIVFSKDYAASLKALPQLENELGSLKKQLERQEIEAQLKKEQEKQKKQSKQDELAAGASALLTLLQKEARFLDFVQENVDSIDDNRMGAVSRLVHKDLARTFKQYVTLETVLDRNEGELIDIEDGFDTSEIRLSGNVDKEPPFKGTLRHKGWLISHLNLPKKAASSNQSVLLPAEIEVPN